MRRIDTTTVSKAIKMECIDIMIIEIIIITEIIKIIDTVIRSKIKIFPIKLTEEIVIIVIITLTITITKFILITIKRTTKPSLGMN